MARPKSQPAKAAETFTAEQIESARAEADRITEAKRLGLDLQRIALRLNELGCAVAAGRVLDAAVRVSKLKAGRFA